VSLYAAAFGFGLISLAVIAVGAVGFTMQFGITNLINLAYGDIMITSAFAAYFLNHAGVSIWIALLGGAATGAVFSFLLNRFIYAPFQRRGTPLIGMVIDRGRRRAVIVLLSACAFLLFLLPTLTLSYEVRYGWPPTPILCAAAVLSALAIYQRWIARPAAPAAPVDL